MDNEDILNSIVIDKSLVTTEDSDLPIDLLDARMSIESLYREIIEKVESIHDIKDDKQKLNDLLELCNKGIDFYEGSQLNAKTLANSLYGYIGASFSRYYKKCVAADITAEGRNATKMLDVRTTQYFKSPRGWIMETEFFNMIKEKYPNLVTADKLETVEASNGMTVYGDTDSLFFTLKPILDSLGVPKNANTYDVCMLCVDIVQIPMGRVQGELLRRYAENRNCENLQVFELEAILRRTIHLAKKKYVGSYLWKDGKYIAKDLKIKGTGVELAQKTTPLPIKKIIKKFVYYMLSSKDISDDSYFKMAFAAVKKFDDMHIDEYAKSRGLGTYNKYHSINRKGEYYDLKRADQVTKGANWYNNEVVSNNLTQKYPLIAQGSRVKFYITKDGRTFTYPIDDNCSFPSEFAPEPDIRANLDKQMFAPIRRIMCRVTDADLSLLGSDVLQSSLSIFKQ